MLFRTPVLWNNCEQLLLPLSNFITHFCRQSAKSANLKKGVSRKQNTPNFPKNEHFSLPDTHKLFSCCILTEYGDNTCVSGGKKCSFFGKFGELCFLETRLEILPFSLLPTFYGTDFLPYPPENIKKHGVWCKRSMV